MDTSVALQTRERTTVAVASAALTLPYTTPQLMTLAGPAGLAADLILLVALTATAFVLGPNLVAIDLDEPMGASREQVLFTRPAAVLAGIITGLTAGAVLRALG